MTSVVILDVTDSKYITTPDEFKSWYRRGMFSDMSPGFQCSTFLLRSTSHCSMSSRMDAESVDVSQSSVGSCEHDVSTFGAKLEA
jgi:hypothetical protein